jgi:hypothetical protein
MKLLLISYIGLLTLLGFVVQLGLPTATLTITFIALNIVFLPIILAYLLKFYFLSISRPKSFLRNNI